VRKIGLPHLDTGGFDPATRDIQEGFICDAERCTCVA
jgi:hypothetical protein